MNKKTIVLLLSLIGFTARAQTTLSIGDLSILGFNSNAPDNFVFVPWVNLAADTIIKFSDNGFLSSSSSTTSNNASGKENFVIWKNTTGSAISAGTVIKIEGLTTSIGTASAGSTSGLSAISSSGDQIFAYQGSATSGTSPDYSSNANPATFSGTALFLLNFQSSFLTTGTATSNTSYLPSDLNVTNGSIVLTTTGVTSAQYSGSRTNQSSITDYRAMVNNSANWTETTGGGTTTLDTTAFSAIPEPSTYAAMFGAAALLGAVWHRRRQKLLTAAAVSPERT